MILSSNYKIIFKNASCNEPSLKESAVMNHIPFEKLNTATAKVSTWFHSPLRRQSSLLYLANESLFQRTSKGFLLTAQLALKIDVPHL